MSTKPVNRARNRALLRRIELNESSSTSSRQLEPCRAKRARSSSSLVELKQLETDLRQLFIGTKTVALSTKNDDALTTTMNNDTGELVHDEGVTRFEKVWDVKPLVNWKEIMSVLQLKFGGPLVKEWLAHPSGIAEDCLDWMKETHSKRVKLEFGNSADCSKTANIHRFWMPKFITFAARSD
ncbi:hypothetical protein Patl1_29958 [Pistacia atlantica]|uniref:Uncharacterized protein n=1 Tax=Pistacia atlantica TaxID=434234 RepID=A0ACC1ADJ0_9ROSI|nr:hypothetical protein Patl1_29958 [Pistacia atlantica]